MFSYLYSLICILFIVGIFLWFIFLISLSFFLPAWCYYKPLTDMLVRRILLVLRWLYRFLKARALQVYAHPWIQGLLQVCWDILVILFYKLYRYFSLLGLSRLYFIYFRFLAYKNYLFKYWAFQENYYYPWKIYLRRGLAARKAKSANSTVWWVVGYPLGFFIYIFKDAGNVARNPWTFWQFTYEYICIFVWGFFFFQSFSLFYNMVSFFFFFFGLSFNDAFFVDLFFRVVVLFSFWFVYSLGRMGFFIYLYFLGRRRREVNFFYFFIIFLLILFFFFYVFYNGFMDFYCSVDKLWGKPSFWRPIVFFFFFFLFLNIYSYIAYRCYCMECWLCLLEKKEQDLPIGYY